MKSRLSILTLCTIGLLFCFNCQSKKNNVDTDHPVLRVTDITETSIYDIFSSLEIISLETNEESLIQEMTKTIIFENKYYIFDMRLFTVFVFDKEGKFLQKTHRIGHGPGEYTMIYDFLINEKERKIELLNPYGSILVYNMEGDYLETKNLPNPPPAYRYLNLINDSTYALYSLVQHDALPINIINKGDITSIKSNNFKHGDPVVTSFAIEFYKYNSQLFLSEAISDYVYKIDKNDYKIAYEWRFNHRMNPFYQTLKSTLENRNEITLKYVDLYNSDNKNYVRSKNFQNNKYYYTLVEYKRYRQAAKKDYNYYNTFYDKELSNSLYFMETTEGLRFKVLRMNEEYAVAQLDPACIDKVLNEGKIDYQEVLRLYKNDDNPILLKLYFK